MKKLNYLPLPRKADNRTWVIVAVCIIFGIAAMRIAYPYVHLFESVHPAPPYLVCQTHLSAIGRGLNHYADTHSGFYPPDLATIVVLGDITPDLLCCPTSQDSPASTWNSSKLAAEVAKPEHCSYQFLAAGQNSRKLSSDDAIVIEKSPFHVGFINVLFADGNVEDIPLHRLNAVLNRRSATTQPPL